MTSEIIEQTYPMLCINCIRVDDRLDLDDKKQLILYSIGRESTISEKDIKKYRMEWDTVHTFYHCKRCHALSAPDISTKLFWNECTKCGQVGLNIQDQEKYIQKITVERVLDEESKELKSIPHVEWIENKDVKKTTCKKCGHSGFQIDEKRY